MGTARMPRIDLLPQISESLRAALFPSRFLFSYPAPRLVPCHTENFISV